MHIGHGIGLDCWQLEGARNAAHQQTHKCLAVVQQHRLVFGQLLGTPLAIDDGMQHLEIVLALFLHWVGVPHGSVNVHQRSHFRFNVQIDTL